MNEQEKKLIRKYSLLPELSAAFLAMALGIGVVWLILVMIDDLLLNGGFYMLGLNVYIGIAAVYTVAFAYCFLVPRLGMRKEKWQDIVRKANISMSNKEYTSQMAGVLGARAAGSLLNMSENENVNKVGDALEVVSAIGTVVTVTQMTNEISKNAKETAKRCGVQIPNAKKYIISIVVLPILLLIAVYIPQFMASKQNTDASIALASNSVYKLQSALQQDCARVHIDDPKEDYDSDGYQVTGYLYAYEEELNSYVSINVGNDGFIQEVRYYVDINIQTSKEENLTKAELDLLKLNVMMNDANVNAITNELLEEYELPDDFKTQFQDVSYYDTVHFTKSENTSISYMSDSEEDYDEYSDSYIYLTIKAKQKDN